MPAQIIDGSSIAAKLKADVQQRVRDWEGKGKKIQLAAILVGGTPAGELYAQRQGEACLAVGIGYELLTLPAGAGMRDVKQVIRRLNKDPAVTGIMMHLPLPPGLDTQRLQYEIDVVKDVEGVNPANIGYVVYGHTLIAPCTALCSDQRGATPSTCLALAISRASQPASCGPSSPSPHVTSPLP